MIKQPDCHGPQAFYYIFCPLSSWGEGWWSSFGGHLTSSQGQHAHLNVIIKNKRQAPTLLSGFEVYANEMAAKRTAELWLVLLSSPNATFFYKWAEKLGFIPWLPWPLGKLLTGFREPGRQTARQVKPESETPWEATQPSVPQTQSKVWRLQTGINSFEESKRGEAGSLNVGAWYGKAIR